MDMEIPEWIKNSEVFIEMFENKEETDEDTFKFHIDDKYKNFSLKIRNIDEYINFLNMLSFWQVNEIPFKFLNIIRNKKFIDIRNDGEVENYNNYFYKEILKYIFLDPQEMSTYAVYNNMKNLYMYTYYLKKKEKYYTPGFFEKLDIKFIISTFEKIIDLGEDCKSDDYIIEIFTYDMQIPMEDLTESVIINYKEINGNIRTLVKNEEDFNHIFDHINSISNYVLFKYTGFDKLTVKDLANKTMSSNFQDEMYDLKSIKYYPKIQTIIFDY